MHNESVNERLYKAKTMQQSQSSTYNKTIKPKGKSQSAMKHASSAYYNNRRHTEAMHDKPSDRYDPEFFGPADIVLNPSPTRQSTAG